MSSEAEANPRSAPNSAASAATLPGPESATAASVPPAARTAAAWTPPMNPMPIMPDRTPDASLPRAPPSVGASLRAVIRTTHSPSWGFHRHSQYRFDQLGQKSAT